VDFNDYQALTKRTAQYPDASKRTPNAINYVILGMIGEAGEMANHWKKVIRGDKDPAVAKEQLRWELGDVLWYVARAAEELGMKLDDVANANLDKLNDRQRRGTIKGDGDGR
jgi:NTP pyrophosphatase (non-canonical NTP hydrolase)